MLVQCWASVVDGGTTLDQHFVDVVVIANHDYSLVHSLYTALQRQDAVSAYL